MSHRWKRLEEKNERNRRRKFTKKMPFFVGEELCQKLMDQYVSLGKTIETNAS